MPVPVQQRPMGASEPSNWQKMKMGAMMGAGVGLTIGFIFGGWTIIRGGAGPRGALPTLSQYMLSSAATFSFFLSIGSVIRNDSGELVMVPLAARDPHAWKQMRLQQARNMNSSNLTPIIASRREGAEHLLATRWAERRLR